jgi:hypothetical protein
VVDEDAGDDLGEDEEESLDGVVVAGEATLTEADYLATWDAVPQFRPLKAIRIWLFVMVLMGLQTLHFFEGAPIGWVTAVLPLLFVGALLVGVARGKRTFARNVISDMGGGQISYRFSDEGFGIQTPRAKSVVAWESLAELIERPAYFLVFTAPQQFVLVAKRAFSADDVETLRQMLGERIVKKPLRGVPPKNAGRTLMMWVALIVAFLVIWQFLGR